MNARSIAGGLGLRQYDVSVLIESWSGSIAGEGTLTSTETAVTEKGQPPKVRSANEKRVALGLAEVGEITVGPLTPVEGSAWATLEQTGATTGKLAKLKLTHRETGDVLYYRIVESGSDSTLHSSIRAVPLTE